MALASHPASEVAGKEETRDLDTTGLCLLSLDGGGVRGLSSLFILKGLMTRLNFERQAVGLARVKPCDIFDLIGGTSTGGIIAIMLGRLEMDVDECIKAYTAMMKKVFKNKRSAFFVSITGNVKARFSSKTLETAIKEVLRSKGFKEDDLLLDEANPEATGKCKVFVCAKSQEGNHIRRLKSYNVQGRQEEDNPKIWEAALATSAAPSFFDPVQIGACSYVDGALGANNPVNQVEEEAADIWCEETGRLQPIVKCFISIGTGHADFTTIKNSSLRSVAHSIEKVATETKKADSEFTGRWREHLDTRYFRFNVEEGLHSVRLAEYKQQAVIDAGTRLYMDGHGVKRKVRTCVQNLRQKRYEPDRAFCLEQTKLEEQREKAEQRDRDRPKMLGTTSEISELVERGDANRRKAPSTVGKEDLLSAQEDFTRALRGMNSQNPLPKAKEFARIYQKLMSTSLRLSHLLAFTENERMAYVREAEKHGTFAMEHAIRSQNDQRVSQMRFYMSCVHAREVCLMSEIGNVPADALLSRRDRALEEISVSLSELQSFEDMDMAVYEVMAREYSQALSRGTRV
ncbi:uncharacterized protein A1O5_02532 [Cladophialophora psammophila CBS 110553]|uniref:PNPLA domain-containing protein n=1 Tax=Cladophialophora psammophila CBS 110553 TaxID=1182543 RepID=W9XBD8_9EURO|nr:uncharacterized protein A1O5_02532 [Cladophialophora psammophila CBS 110553]EXJ74236.1 hypothetical protein A1O5_02532 [Cladophialophora psammophila CBS 110553]